MLAQSTPYSQLTQPSWRKATVSPVDGSNDHIADAP